MKPKTIQRLRGLKKLLHDSIDIGTDFVEKHHRNAADKSFDILEQIDPIVIPVKTVRVVYNGTIFMTYESIHFVNKAVATLGDLAFKRLLD